MKAAIGIVVLELLAVGRVARADDPALAQVEFVSTEPGAPLLEVVPGEPHTLRPVCRAPCSFATPVGPVTLRVGNEAAETFDLRPGHTRLKARGSSHARLATGVVLILAGVAGLVSGGGRFGDMRDGTAGLAVIGGIQALAVGAALVGTSGPSLGIDRLPPRVSAP